MLEWGRQTIPFPHVRTSAKRRWERIGAIWERILVVSAGHSSVTCFASGSSSGRLPRLPRLWCPGDGLRCQVPSREHSHERSAMSAQHPTACLLPN